MSPIIEARLMLLPFALLVWLSAWSLRFFPNPVKPLPLRLAVCLLFSSIFLGTAIGQILLSAKLLNGISVLANDYVFLIMFGIEYAIGLCIVILSNFASASAAQRKR
jgi:hypothetical protein